MAGDRRITLGAAVLPEPERAWLGAVEELPVDSVWQGGHLLPPGSSGEAITRLALMTAWTERVQVGTAVLLLPLYHPVVVAKQLADLDAHSGGRLRVGIGVGGEFPKEFEAVGVPLSERGARTDESIEVMRLLWSGRPVSHHGRFFQFDDVRLHPVRPPGATADGQAGGPPIIVSGRRPPALRRAARLGDGFMPYLVSAGAYTRSVQAIRDTAQEAGRDLAGFEWMLYLYTSIRRRRGPCSRRRRHLLAGSVRPPRAGEAPADRPGRHARRGGGARPGVHRRRSAPYRRLPCGAVGNARGGQAGGRRGPAPVDAAAPAP